MKPAIVIAFSLSGHTRRVGVEIAQRLGCPIIEITEPRPRHGTIAYLRSGFEALFGRMPRISQIDRNLRDFPLIVIGTPVWVGHLSSPVRSFLSRHRTEIESLAAFCTMGGRDLANTFADIATVAGKLPVATCAISENELGSAKQATRLDAFIAAINVARGDD